MAVEITIALISTVCPYCTQQLERFLKLDLQNTELQCVRERETRKLLFNVCSVATFSINKSGGNT